MRTSRNKYLVSNREWFADLLHLEPVNILLHLEPVNILEVINAFYQVYPSSHYYLNSLSFLQ